VGATLPAWIVDLILAGVFVEGVLLLRLRAAGALCSLAAGTALLLALRAALLGAAWWITAGCLLGALCAHLADLRLRIPRRRPDTV
jgi:hypothetical protein